MEKLSIIRHVSQTLLLDMGVVVVVVEGFLSFQLWKNPKFSHETGRKLAWFDGIQ